MLCRRYSLFLSLLLCACEPEASQRASLPGGNLASAGEGMPPASEASCFAGIVLDENGNRCSGFRVTVAHRIDGHLKTLASVVTDSEGVFRIPEAQPNASPIGRIEVRADDDGLALQSPIVRGEDCIVRVSRGARRLSGRVQVPDLDKQECHIRLQLNSIDAIDAEREILLPLSADGTFAVDTRVPLDLVRPSVMARVIGEGVHCQRYVSLDALLAGTAVIGLEHARLAVTLAKNGKPVRGARYGIALTAADRSRSYHTIRNARDDGGFSVVTDSGSMEIWCLADGEPVFMTRATLKPDELTNLQLELPAANHFVRGRILDDAGRSLAGALVFCLPVTAYGDVFNTFLKEPYIADADGRFSIPLAGEQQTFRVFSQSAVAMSRIAQVKDGATLDIPYDAPPCAINYSIRGLSTEPLVWDGVTLAVVDKSGVSARMLWGAPDAVMRANVRASDIDRLVLAGPGFRTIADGRLTVTGPSACEVHFDLVPSESLEVNLADIHGEPVRNAAVRLLWDTQLAFPWERSATAADGKCVLHYDALGRDLIGLEARKDGLAARLSAGAVQEACAARRPATLVLR